MGFLLIFAVGFGLLSCGLYAIWKYAPAKWQQTQAVVIHNKANPHPDRYGPRYTPYVRYRYEVGGETYHGDSYAFSSAEDMGSLESTNKILQQYAEGNTIHIWYQIHQPSTSCIKLKSSYSCSQMLALIVGGILVLCLGVAVLMASST